MVQIKKRKGLGRGLDVLLNPDDLPNASSLIDENKEYKEIKISNLITGKYQPRKQIDESSLQELARSIEQQGVIQPILVRRITDNKYEIIAGERRTRAAKLAGLTTVPAIIKDINDKTAAAIALIENIQREDLNAIDEALGIERLLHEFNLTHEQLAKSLGKSRSVISNSLRLLQLAEPVKLMLQAGDIDMGHARALLAVDAATQELLANQVINRKLSVRNTESLVKNYLLNLTKPPPLKNKLELDLEKKERQLQKYLHLPVKIKLNKTTKSATAGQISVRFKNIEQLELLLSGLKK